MIRFFLYIVPVVCGLLASMLILGGCATNRRTTGLPAQEREEVESALRSVVGSLSGEEVSEEELRRIARELEHDPETRQAVESISGAYTPGQTQVKYCPVDGKRYSPDQDLCPQHNVTLEWVE